MSEQTPPIETQPASESPVAGEQSGGQDILKMMPKDIQDYVNELKAKGVNVFMTLLGDRAYLFRSLNVMEWMKLQEGQKQRAQAQDANEDFLQQALFESIVMLANLGVIVTDENGKEQLQPKITRDNIKMQPAGVPNSLSQQVMYQSGFDGNPVTFKL